MKHVPPIGSIDPNANYVTENLAAGVEGSPVPAEAIEHPMREIVAAIEAAGLTPDGEQLDQLAQAIVKLAGVRFKGFEVAGTHTAYEGDLDAIVHNSLYACDSAHVQNAPDLPAGTWAYVHTMVLPLDAGRTQLCWTADDPDHPGWNRRRTGAGAWSSWKEIGSGGGTGVAVGDLCWSSTGKPSPGCVAANVKQKFVRGLYPQLVARVLADGGYLATEAAWDAEAAAQEGSCGRFALTDTHIILPCYKHHFAAAQAGVTGKEAGDWLADAFKEHYHLYGDNPWQNVDFGSEPPNRTMGNHSSTVSAATPKTSVVGGEETRPKTSYILPCIKVADVATNGAQVDMLALANQVAQINGDKVDRSEFTFFAEENGRFIFPVDGSGKRFMIQWGVKDFSGTARNTDIPVTFPIAFPNVCLNVLTERKSNTYAPAGSVDSFGAYTYTPTGFQFQFENSTAAAAIEGSVMVWFAIGF